MNRAAVSGPVRILCALEFERAALRRAGIERLAGIDVCGPGEVGVEEWARAQADPAAAYILAGVAGGLHEDWTAGRGTWIARVVDAAGEAWHPTWPGRADAVEEDPRATLLSVEQLVTARADRLRWAARHGAVMVDLEAATFARIATARGWRWGIVKAVSDDLDLPLPVEAAAWVTPEGRTSLGAVIQSVTLRPALLPSLIKLGRHSRRAMATVAQLLLDELPQ